MKIEWASNFAPDGRRRSPPPSTIHGWLAKWRGTLSGDENLRSRGMAEMRKAASFRHARRRYEQKKAARSGKSSSSLLSFFRGKGPRKSKLSGRPRTQSNRPKGSQVPRRAITRNLESKSSPRNVAGQKRPPPRSRPKAKPQQGSSRRPVHGRS